METRKCYFCERDVAGNEWDMEQEMCTTCVPKQTVVCYYCGKRYPNDYFTIQRGENCCDDCFIAVKYGPDGPLPPKQFKIFTEQLVPGKWLVGEVIEPKKTYPKHPYFHNRYSRFLWSWAIVDAPGATEAEMDFDYLSIEACNYIELPE